MKERKEDKKYLPEEILPKVIFSDKRVKTEINGINIKMSSLRLQTFAKNGIICKQCGIEGKYFVMEKIKGQDAYHLNLYAVDSDGKEILMTKDHIIPVCKGGKDTLENLQTMCTVCNFMKGGKLDSNETRRTD